MLGFDFYNKNTIPAWHSGMILLLFDENGIFYIQSGREERWPPKFVRHGYSLYKSWHCFRRMCAYFLFLRIREYCRELFYLRFKRKFVCLRGMLAAKIKCSLSKQEIIH